LRVYLTGHCLYIVHIILILSLPTNPEFFGTFLFPGYVFKIYVFFLVVR